MGWAWEMSWGGGAKRGELRGAGLRRAWAFQAGGACEVGDGYTGSTDGRAGPVRGCEGARAIAPADSANFERGWTDDAQRESGDRATGAAAAYGGATGAGNTGEAGDRVVAAAARSACGKHPAVRMATRAPCCWRGAARPCARERCGSRCRPRSGCGGCVGRASRIGCRRVFHQRCRSGIHCI